MATEVGSVDVWSTPDIDIQVHRVELPITDEWTLVENVAKVVHIDTRRREVLEMWVERWFTKAGDLIEFAPSYYRVFGTGHPIENAKNLYHVGSVVHRDGEVYGHLVWHVYGGGKPGE